MYQFVTKLGGDRDPDTNKALVIVNEKKPALLVSQTKLHVSVIEGYCYH